MSLKNLRDLWAQADEMDISDGIHAYQRYHEVMKTIAAHFSTPLNMTTAAFVALSPNSDYLGNLRSLISMLEAKRQGFDYEDAIVSTYNACRARAALYLKSTPFLDHAKGLKTRAFYQNILEPTKPGPVTVDGYMYHAWAGTTGGMRDANITKKIYGQISEDISKLARQHGYLPHETQAILWFARKRINGVVYSGQLDLFGADLGFQKTTFSVEEIKPYGVNHADADTGTDTLGAREGATPCGSQRSQLDLPL
jgi:hypothetical protein